MQLDAYIRDNGLSEEAFARLLGTDVSAWAVKKWRYGQRIPRLALQRRIADVTKGKVTANDLVAAVIANATRRESKAAIRQTEAA